MFFLKLFFSNATKHWKILIYVYIRIYKAFEREKQSIHCFLIIVRSYKYMFVYDFYIYNSQNLENSPKNFKYPKRY